MAKLTGMQKREERLFYVFISPWIIGFLVFSVMPLLTSLGLSFTEYNFFKPPEFVGVANYTRLLQGDLFPTALWNTLFMVIFGVPIWIMVALGLSLLISRDVQGIRTFRTIFYLPAVTSGVAVSILWLYVFLPDYGLIASLLALFNVRSPFWLGDPNLVKPAFIIMGAWAAGGNIPLYLAAIKGVPKELYEAAEIDGARLIDRFFRITIPFLTPVLFFSFVTGVIASFQYFTQSYVMTNGGPANATLFLGLYIYREAFNALRLGSASALAWILFIIIVLATAVQFLGARLWVYYES